MQEYTLEKYYKEVFGKYEGMPDFSELTESQKMHMERSSMYARYKAGIAIQRLINTLRDYVFGFIEKIFKQ